MSKGNGTFGDPNFMCDFGVKQGWEVGRHHRAVIDVNGDGKADIIGFGNKAGPYVALGSGDGTFRPATFLPPPAR